MTDSLPLALSRITTLVFDFDGVLTDNRVYVDENGRESVCCHRSDGLAFDALRRSRFKLFILSTETNPVVSARARKLNIPVYQGVRDKQAALRDLAQKHSLPLQHVLYVGNDLNDYHAMRACGFAVCPRDSHPHIKAVAHIILKTKGGGGIVRELAEDVLRLDLLALLTSQEE